MATTQELIDAVTALTAAFQPMFASIDALEAAVQSLREITVQVAKKETLQSDSYPDGAGYGA